MSKSDGQCDAILKATGEHCTREYGHDKYHSGSGGPFGPWQGPDSFAAQVDGSAQ